MPSNPNEISADYYDIVSHPFKNENITDQEISLINFLKDNSGNIKILDIGVGTGRHLIPLSEIGYKVTGIDSSRKMISNLQKKAAQKSLKIKLGNKDILDYKSNEQFDLIIMMWNSFNEIALTKKRALQLLRKLKKLLVKDGIILINIDDANKIQPEKFNFQTNIIKDNLEYKLHWSIYKYYPKTNTSISEEEITILKGKQVLKKTTTLIKQRYWRLDEIQSLIKKLQFNLLQKKIIGNNELYLILKKDS